MLVKNGLNAHAKYSPSTSHCLAFFTASPGAIRHRAYTANDSRRGKRGENPGNSLFSHENSLLTGDGGKEANYWMAAARMETELPMIHQEEQISGYPLLVTLVW